MRLALQITYRGDNMQSVFVNYPPPEGGWACNYPVVVTELTSDLFLNEKVLIGDVASQGD